MLIDMNTVSLSRAPNATYEHVEAASNALVTPPAIIPHARSASFNAQLQSAVEVVSSLKNNEVELRNADAEAAKSTQDLVPAPMHVDGRAYLQSEEADVTSAHNQKPTVAAFMQATGANFTTAANVLSGVVGSNTDYRNWPAIMASEDPLAAARAATGAMYQSDLPYGAPSVPPLAKDTVLAQSGPYTVTQTDEHHQLWLTASTGQPLRQVGLDAPQILAAAQDFGFSTEPLAAVAEQLAEKGVVLNGASNGLDLKALATGNLGTPHDWTQDPLVHLKGLGAWSVLQANRALAEHFGINTTLNRG